MASLEGIDVSHREGAINWHEVREAGIGFAFIKATQGKDFVDSHAVENLERCREVGIVPGMYHFYRHDQEPEKQAANFLALLGARKPGDLVPALDVEGPGDGAGPMDHPKADVVRRVGEVVSAVKAEIGRAPMIYTYPAAWVEVTGNSPAFAGECPLWIASYKVARPTLPGGWKDYAVWQYDDHGTVKGVGGGVDRDRFNGDGARLNAFRIGGGLSKGGKAVLNQEGKLRSAAGVSSPELGVLPRGTAVVLTDGPETADGRDWWKVADGAGKSGWCSSIVLSPA